MLMNTQKKVLVTGAQGMLGQDLCNILEKKGFVVIKTTK
jgi:dTDP-4-dehydrorhamnose reductase